MNTAFAWAACIEKAMADGLGHIRLVAGVEVCELYTTFWLRGTHTNEELERELKNIPGLRRFEPGGQGRWRDTHSLIPSITMPDGQWRPAAEMLRVIVPEAAFPAQNRRKVPLTLERCELEQPASALLIGLSAWAGFAAGAPAVRLAPLRFATEEGGRVLVMGSPLPALPGTRLLERDGILVPCGWTWSPAVSPRVLRQLFRLETGTVVLLTEAGTHQTINAEQFVPASRSAARFTLAAQSHD